MNESPPVFYRTSSPLGPLPCFLSLQFTIMQSRATGMLSTYCPWATCYVYFEMKKILGHFSQFLLPRIPFTDPPPPLRGGGTPPNRSPKGNMWSAIPVALLCMIVNLSEGKQGSGPEGAKSCRTQGDFRSSVCLSIGLSVWAEFRSKRADVRPESQLGA